jgi:predicted RNA-binding Zn ribbon-like protein
MIWLQKVRINYSMQQGKHIERYNSFRFDAGSLALNFVATVRHRGSHPRDLLILPEALNKWILQSDLSSEPVLISPKNLRLAVQLREAIHDTIYALITSLKPQESDIILINTIARQTTPVPRLSIDTCNIELDIPTVKSCLALVARDAVEQIGYPGRQRLKMCENDSCRMLFTDISPANRRRWCSMSICGNRAKVALHRRNMKSIEQE